MRAKGKRKPFKVGSFVCDGFHQTKEISLCLVSFDDKGVFLKVLPVTILIRLFELLLEDIRFKL